MEELVSPPYEIAIVAISYGRVTKSSVRDSMMLKKYGVALVRCWYIWMSLPGNDFALRSEISLFYITMRSSLELISHVKMMS